MAKYEALGNAIESAVRKACEGKEVGVAFSGGMDSGLVAALAKKYARSVTCYTCGTDDSFDVAAGKELAEKLGLPWVHCRISEESIANHRRFQDQQGHHQGHRHGRRRGRVGIRTPGGAGMSEIPACDSGKCPLGIATQDWELEKRLDVKKGAQRVANYLNVTSDELRSFCRVTGHEDIHDMGLDDLCTTDSEIADATGIRHA